MTQSSLNFLSSLVEISVEQSNWNLMADINGRILF